LQLHLKEQYHLFPKHGVEESLISMSLNIAVYWISCYQVTLFLQIEDLLSKVVLGFTAAEVKTPPFIKGKKQLSRCEIDWSQEISHVRIHVE